jgi:Collagen triple helix repeat (20 copies)
MSRQLDNTFVDGDLINVDYVKQLIQPVEDLESGKAYYREATLNGSNNFEVNFSQSGNAGGYYLNSLSAGQIIVFKAMSNSPASAQLEVLMESGGPIVAPLYAASLQVGLDEISADQIVVAVYNNTSTPRFDIVGLAAAQGQGTQGPTGPQGPAGPTGADGSTGPQGAQGLQGIPGDAGPQGPAGNDGADGAQGLQGLQGDTGPAGPQGPPGSDGADGAQGPQGLQGDIGPQGPAGNDGADGAQGPQGLQGNTGAVGPQGPAGNDGADGAQGPQGPQGDTGPAGPQGATTGDILYTAQAAPSGFLEANGQVVSQTTYADLYAEVGLINDGPLSWNSWTWTKATTPNTVDDLYSVTYGKGLFVAAGFSGSIWTSPNGEDWTKETAVPNFTDHFYAVAYGNDIFVAIGYNSALWRSTCGKVWEKVYTYNATDSYYAITFGNGVFIAVGNGFTCSSIDGYAWGRVSTPSTALYGVTYANGVFIAVGNSGKILTSRNDGRSWTTETSPASRSYRCITYSGYYTGYFTCGSLTAHTAYSTDEGSSWVEKTPPASGYAGIAYIPGNAVLQGQTVMVGSSGKIARSANGGHSWGSQTGPNTTDDLKAIVHAQHRLVVVGSNGVVWNTDADYYYDDANDFRLPSLPTKANGIKPWIKT